jgi:DNA polymerase III delta subunit
MPSVYLLTGENDVFKRKRIEELLAPFDRENVQNLYAEEHEAGEIFAQCYQSSLFGGRTAVVVRRIVELKDSAAKNFTKSLVRYLDSVNDDVLLVLDWDSPTAEASRKIKDTKAAIVEEFKTVYRSASPTTSGGTSSSITSVTNATSSILFST